MLLTGTNSLCKHTVPFGLAEVLYTATAGLEERQLRQGYTEVQSIHLCMVLVSCSAAAPGHEIFFGCRAAGVIPCYPVPGAVLCLHVC